jgi:hypothetical protein
MSEASQTPKIEKIQCATCLHATNHTVLHSYETSWDDGEVSGGSTHEFMKCNGCDMPTYRRTSWFSEEPEPSYEFYPDRRSKEVGRRPKEFEHLPWGGPTESVYRQTVSAFTQGLLTLAGAGVRLNIEGICKERKIKDGDVTDKNGTPRRKDNLEGKINGLAEKNFISKKQADALHQIRFLGNDAAHELYQPTRATVSTALDIIEHLLEQVYE